jgi:RimJ/RimL family protein N-acetyltransferase
MRGTASGKLVTVRAYRPEDTDRLFTAVTESVLELSPYETWCHPGYTREEAAEYVNWWCEAWSRGEAYYFAVEHRATGEFLGSCGLSDLVMEHKRAGLGFWIRSSRTGRGFATEAAQIVGCLAFEDLGLERLELETAVHNAASRRVVEKLGCTFEGILHRRLVLPGGPTDTAMYCWLRSKAGEGPRPTS